MKKLILFFITLVISFMLISCTQQGDKQVDNAKAAGYEKVPLTRLIANPEDYHGKKIRVKGFASIMWEMEKLYVSKEGLEYTSNEFVWLSNELSKDSEAWIIGGEEITAEMGYEMTGKFYEVFGTFDMNYEGQGVISDNSRDTNGAIIVDKMIDLSNFKYYHPMVDIYSSSEVE